MRTLYVPAKARFCLVTYQDEKDLPEGQKLRTCSRCNEACYISREAQVEHWPLHKKVCCPIEKDHPALREEDYNHEVGLKLNTIDGCAKIVELFLKYPTEMICLGASRLLTFALRRLKELLSEDPRYFVPSHGDNESILGSCFTGAFTMLSSDELDHLFAIPGFANYFLSDELFLTKEMAIRKEKGLGPLPCAERKEGEEMNEKDFGTFDGYEDVEEAERKYPGTYTSPFYCSAVCQLIVNWIVLIQSNHWNKPDLLSALHRRIFRTWVCPYGRISFSDIRNPATAHWDGYLNRSGIILWFLNASILPAAQNCYTNWGNEALPGITAFQLFTRMLDDNVAFSDIEKQEFTLPNAIKLLISRELHAPKRDNGYLHLTTDERILLFDRIITEDVVGFIVTAEGRKITCKNMLTVLVTGCCSSQVLIQMYHRLNKQLSKNDKFVDGETKMLIHNLWGGLQEASIPALAAYVDVVETHRQRKQNAGPGLGKPLEFPKEISELICEFSFQDEYDFTWTCL